MSEEIEFDPKDGTQGVIEHTEKVEPKKTRTVKPKVEPVTKLDIDRLEACLSKLAVMTGQGNILNQFGIERWMPSKDDLKRKW